MVNEQIHLSIGSAMNPIVLLKDRPAAKVNTFCYQQEICREGTNRVPLKSMIEKDI